MAVLRVKNSNFVGLNLYETMEQRDFLEREIDQLSRVLGRIVASLLGLKSGSVSTLGVEIANRSLKGVVDLDVEQLLSVERGSLIEFLVADRGFSNDNLDQLVDIILAFTSDMASSDSRRNLYYERCLTICEYTERQQALCLDRYLKLEQIKANLV